MVPAQPLAHDLTVRCAAWLEMDHLRAAHHKVVRDHGAVTAPPHGLGAHDRAPLLASERAQRIKAGAEWLGLGVVSVIPERRDAPVQIVRGWRAFTMMTPATERAQLPVADAVDGEGIRQPMVKMASPAWWFISGAS